jgi:thymidylate kinase
MRPSPLLVILEGCDRLGKTTQAQRLEEYFTKKGYNTQYIKQPSSDNTLGFLRPVVKLDPEFKPFERQLLHTATHIVDAYEVFDNPDNEVIIMDRCFISALMYGQFFGLTEKEVKLLEEIHHAVYNRVIQDKFEVQMVFITASEPLTPPNADNYEKMVEKEEGGWYALNAKYLGLANQLISTPKSTNEIYHILDVTDKTEEDVFEDLISLIDGE